MNQQQQLLDIVDTLGRMEDKTEALRGDVAANGYGTGVGAGLALVQRALNVIATDINGMRNLWEAGDVQGESLHTALNHVKSHELKLRLS